VLKSFLFKRPNWFKHEGYWRLAQVLRLGPTFIFITFGVLFIAGSAYLAIVGENPENSGLVFVTGWFTGAATYLVVIHWLIRVAVWVTEGFKGQAQ
jgi:divalent metal cation (Fe/Co/Zn/Cd) transporter